MASVGVICHLGICLQELDQGVLGMLGAPHMFYSVCGSREMGTLGGTGGEHLDCCHLLLASISTQCLVLASDLAWK